MIIKPVDLTELLIVTFSSSFIWDLLEQLFTKLVDIIITPLCSSCTNPLQSIPSTLGSQTMTQGYPLLIANSSMCMLVHRMQEYLHCLLPSVSSHRVVVYVLWNIEILLNNGHRYSTKYYIHTTDGHLYHKINKPYTQYVRVLHMYIQYYHT